MKPSTLLIVFGVLLLIGGVLAFANPFAASLAVTTIVGIAFLIGGVVQLWLAFSQAEDPHRIWHGFMGLLAVVLGISLLANPLGGLISLTLLVALLFLFSGAARLAMAFRNRESPLFWALLLSGAVSVLLAIMVFGNFAAAATALLGIMLGVQLLSEGVAMIALGILGRKL